MSQVSGAPTAPVRRTATPIPAPPFRLLKSYAFDPNRGRNFGNHMTLQVPFEPLAPGPIGSHLAVIDYDGANKCYYEPVDLNHASVLLRGGLDPSESDPRFHQQMVYAVVSETLQRFRFALGRDITWRQDTGSQDAAFIDKLILFPHAMQEANAYYDPSMRAILFGYFSAPLTDCGDNLPGQTIFTCLSHDIIAHETTHAIVDGIRSFFMQPTNPDVPAFHEAFADIVALFQHFSMREAVEEALQRTRGQLQYFAMHSEAVEQSGGAVIQAELTPDNPLVSMAKQFGDAMGLHSGLRSSLGTKPNSSDLETVFEPHARGSILVAAVFDAFFSIYHRRTRDLWRIAGIGPGSASSGDLHPDLVSRFAAEASKAARQVETMCIRALDYCPPVDVTFGDYLRAIISADYDLVRDDDLGYRPLFIDAFRSRGIRPEGVFSFSEESLRWLPPDGEPIRCPGLKLWIAPDTPKRQRTEIWERNKQLILDFAEANRNPFGLLPEQPIRVASFFPLNRVGPDGQYKFQAVVEVIQTQDVPPMSDGSRPPAPTVYGGATIIFDDDGTVKYGVRKSLVPNKKRGEAQLAYRAQLLERAANITYGGEGSDSLDFGFVHRGY